MKNFVVTDIHDHYDLLIKSLNENGFDIKNKNHRLIVCGDAFYSGPQPGELFTFLYDLYKNERLIFIYGNHDIELLDNLNNKHFTRSANRKCIELIVEHKTKNTGLSDDELILESKNLGFTDFLANVPVWYYETEGYIYTHGFIPTIKRSYNPDWRNSTEREWRAAASKGDAMLLSLKYNVYEPNKIIVCGHYSAARCYLMKNATQIDWENKIYKDVSNVPPEAFKPFLTKTFIALDQSVKKSGFINCIIIKE